MKKIPYGLQSFEKIVIENYYYVDKTKYIETLENFSESYIVFLRPRKFGKSLWIDILDKYYNINYKNRSNDLFKNLYIQKHPTPKKNSYRILRFNFSGLNTDSKEELKHSFKVEVSNKLKEFVSKYSLNMELDTNAKEPSELLKKFISSYNESNNNIKIYLLIDEYDHFANELLSFKLNDFRNIVGQTGFVRKFYEVIKEGTANIIDRIFITGVAPITLDSLTSGFNIAKNMTMYPELNEMMGFTEEEVRKILKEYDIKDEILDDMKFSYNGYMFSEFAEKRVYNSDMVLYFISEFNRAKRKPKDIIDMNIISDYKKIENIFKLGETIGIRGIDLENEKEAVANLLNDILTDGKTEIEVMTRAFNLERKLKINDIKTLLFYLGFLTIENNGLSMGLKIPNYSMRIIYSEYFLETIERRSKKYIDTSKVTLSIRKLLLEGKIEPFAMEIEKILKKLSDRDFINFGEKNIKMLMFSYMILTPWAYVKSEYPVEGGYIDLALFKRFKEVPYNVIIELKYLKKGEKNKILLNKKIEEAKKQIKKYGDSLKKEVDGEIKKYVMVFVGRKLKYLEEVGTKKTMDNGTKKQLTMDN